MIGIKLVKYVAYDVLRSRMVIAYAILLFALSASMFYINSDSAKTTLSLLNVLLLLVPLISIVFGTIHFYNSREFIELLLAQPVSRLKMFLSEYLGLSGSLCLALLAGYGIPLALFGWSTDGLFLLVIGLLLTIIFSALAICSAVMTNDKARGIGLSLLIWFFFSILYDGLVLLMLFYLSDYPLEKVMLVLSALNPIDLGRIAILLRLDTSAMMGFSGAVFQKFLGGRWGTIIALSLLTAWVLIPFWLGIRIFRKKDF